MPLKQFFSFFFSGVKFMRDAHVDSHSFVSVTYKKIEMDDSIEDNGKSLYFTAVEDDTYGIFNYTGPERTAIIGKTKIIKFVVLRPEGEGGPHYGHKIEKDAFFRMPLEDIKELSETKFVELQIVVENVVQATEAANRWADGF